MRERRAPRRTRPRRARRRWRRCRRRPDGPVALAAPRGAARRRTVGQVRRVQHVPVAVDQPGRADTDRRCRARASSSTIAGRGRRPARRCPRAARAGVAPRATVAVASSRTPSTLVPPMSSPTVGTATRSSLTRHRCGAAAALGASRRAAVARSTTASAASITARARGEELVRGVPEMLDRIARDGRARRSGGLAGRSGRGSERRDRSRRSHELHFEPVAFEVRARRPRAARGCRAARAPGGAGRPTTNSSSSVRPSSHVVALGERQRAPKARARRRPHRRAAARRARARADGVELAVERGRERREVVDADAARLGELGGEHRQRRERLVDRRRGARPARPSTASNHGSVDRGRAACGSRSPRRRGSRTARDTCTCAGPRRRPAARG